MVNAQIALKIFFHLWRLSVDNATVAVDVSQINPSHFRDDVDVRWEFRMLNCYPIDFPISNVF